MSRFTSACAERSHATKPCSDGVSRAFVVERQIEKLVEGVGRLVAEPRQEFLAAAVCAEQAGVERERRQRARLFAQRVEPRRDIGPLRAQRAAQAALAGSRRA